MDENFSNSISCHTFAHHYVDNMNSNDWYVDWFNSPYYHILYKERNDTEAKDFIINLKTYLQPSPESKFLDIACGKGRHSIFIDSLGYQVDGFDLSENNIQFAKQNESDTLRFYVNDIRKTLKPDHYDYAFNLFTSFGYFNSEADNQEAIAAMADNLKAGGILVLDFMNVSKVITNLNREEVKEVNGISFNITRSVSNGNIVKKIAFKDQGKDYCFQEVVKAITLEEFNRYFEHAKLNIEAIFGDYNLQPFDIESSDRLILVARKP